MALIECPECKKSISDSINSCPHCGYKIKKSISAKSKTWLILTSVLLAVVIIGVILFVLFKPCEHQWSEATCENASMCELCGETTGDALGHKWLDATCSSPKTCSVCNQTEGDVLEHVWVDATCTEAKKCSVCGVTSGNALGHNWEAATYTNPKTCTVCGLTEGEPLVKPETKVVGTYQMSYFDGMDSVTESLQFSSNGSVVHRCNVNDDNGYGNWSVSGNSISFTLYWDGADHTDYETATVVDGGIMWGSSFLRKVG